MPAPASGATTPPRSLPARWSAQTAAARTCAAMAPPGTRSSRPATVAATAGSCRKTIEQRRSPASPRTSASRREVDLERKASERKTLYLDCRFSVLENLWSGVRLLLRTGAKIPFFLITFLTIKLRRGGERGHECCFLVNLAPAQHGVLIFLFLFSSACIFIVNNFAITSSWKTMSTVLLYVQKRMEVVGITVDLLEPL